MSPNLINKFNNFVFFLFKFFFLRFSKYVIKNLFFLLFLELKVVHLRKKIKSFHFLILIIGLILLLIKRLF